MALMRIRLTVALLAVATALASPAMAAAHLNPKKLLVIQPGSSMALIQSNSEVPLHFTTSGGQAIRVAESSPTLEALHRQMHPLRVHPYVWTAIHPYWYVVFTYRGKIVGDAAVSPTGKLIGAWTIGLVPHRGLRTTAHAGRLARVWKSFRAWSTTRECCSFYIFSPF